MRLTGSRLGHAFGDRAALFTGLDLCLEPGSVTAVTGPSGSGKSTLLNILAGWLRPSTGSLDRSGIRRTRWVFQNPHGVPRRSALDHVVLPLLARGRRRPEAESEALGLLDEFGLADAARRPFRTLSGGEAQRLLLARSLAGGPDLLLVDEPTAQLDAASATIVTDSLRVLAGRGAIVVVATHDPRTREACTARIDLGRYR